MKQTFQSTPPSRVATIPAALRHPDPQISIHTTLAGGDCHRKEDKPFNAQFQSTPPSRVATFLGRALQQEEEISIHTTLAGGDEFLVRTSQDFLNFNPHHPRGWRHNCRRGQQYCGAFQSTPPSRVATNPT